MSESEGFVKSIIEFYKLGLEQEEIDNEEA
jgi:hypothetical protein